LFQQPETKMKKKDRKRRFGGEMDGIRKLWGTDGVVSDESRARDVARFERKHTRKCWDGKKERQPPKVQESTAQPSRGKKKQVGSKLVKERKHGLRNSWGTYTHGTRQLKTPVNAKA